MSRERNLFSLDEVSLLAAALQFAHLNRTDFYRYVNEQGHSYLMNLMENKDHNDIRRRVTLGLSPPEENGMDEGKNKLVAAIRDYAQNTLDGRCLVGGDILSAIVKTIDCAIEGLDDGDDREQFYAEFILAYDTNNQYLNEGTP